MGIMPPIHASNTDALLLSASKIGCFVFFFFKIPLEIKIASLLKYFASHWNSGKAYSQIDWLNGGTSFL